MEKRITLVLGLILMNLALFSQTEIRTYDGSNNNLYHPDWGASHTQFRRLAPPNYSDNIAAPGGQNRSNPRKISNTLFAQKGLTQDKFRLSDFTWVFGQLIDHDLTLSENSAEPAMIPVNFTDIHFNPSNKPNVMIPMMRNKVMEGTGTDPSNPRQHVNEISGFLDGSSVYGSDAFRANWLRSFKGGKLKVSKGNLMPYNTLTGEFDGAVDVDAPFMGDDVGRATRLFVAGDVRANENALLIAFHTIFVREHNRLCEELVSKNPNWSDEQIFQHARKIVGGLLQAITYQEWLPTMGIHIAPYQGYRETVDPGIFNVFAAAAFRMGHTLLNDTLNVVSIDGTPEERMPLVRAFFNPDLVARKGIEPFLKGMGIQVQQNMDTKVMDGVRNFLFGAPDSGAGGLDLAAININRGRERGIPDFNTIRRAVGLRPYRNFYDIIANDEVVSGLEEMYSSINDIDAWVGMLAESHMQNSIFGETVMTILSQQFTALRDGDRFYYENDAALSAEEKATIKKTKFSEIVMRNTGITLMQDNVFHATPHQSICGYYGKDAVLWGDVVNIANNRILGVDVNFTTANNEPIMSSIIDGAFSIAGVPTCEDITITLSKEDSYQNGISTLDMILMLKHIVGLEPFDSPYKHIAADVNKSNSVTTADIVALRKLILGIENSFPNNKAWRFVDRNYVFKNPNNPLAEDFSESTTVNLSQDADQGFIAIKVGDINASASPAGSALASNSSRPRNNAALTFVTEDMALIAGKTYTIPFHGQGEQLIAGYQFTLKDIHSMLEFMQINSLQLNAQNVGIIDQRTTTVSYNGQQYVPAKDLSFELTFVANQNALLSDVLSIQANPTPAEAYNEQLEVMDINIQFMTNPTLQVHQNQPNPFSEWTTIGFELPVTGFVGLEITDLTGRRLFTTANKTYPKGYNEIKLSRSDLAASGVLYYKLTTEQGNITKKMIVIE